MALHHHNIRHQHFSVPLTDRQCHREAGWWKEKRGMFVIASAAHLSADVPGWSAQIDQNVMPSTLLSLTFSPPNTVHN
jgi:hypothetical protein